MRRNVLIAAVVVAIAAIVVAGLIVRSFGDDSGRIEPVAWADSVCSSLSDWRASIESLADVGVGELTADSLRERLEAARSATDDLVTELRELGPPDVEAAETVEEAVDDTAAGIERSYDALEQAAEDALDAETPSAFLQALAGLADDFQSLLERARDTVATLRSASLFGESAAELERAFEDAESCQTLTAGAD